MRASRFLNYLLGTAILPLSFSPLLGAEENSTLDSKTKKNTFLESAMIKQDIFSTSEGTEAGENTEVEAVLKYYPTEDSFFQLRINTDPDKNEVENKTSKLEFILNHKVSDFTFQMDLEMKSNSSGNNSVGPDSDSDYTFVEYKISEQWGIKYYPYNFNGELGDEFCSGDVTTVHYIKGKPDNIPHEKDDDISLHTKTLPGLEVTYKPTENISLMAGFAASRYIYPNDDDFDLRESVNADSWQSKTDKGYKFAASYSDDTTKVELSYISHDEANEAGALLKAASNLQVQKKLGLFTFDLEAAYSKAGTRAYNIDYGNDWFKDEAPWQPIYADENGNLNKFLGEEDYALFTKFSYQIDKVTPYLSYKRLGEYFVFNEDESAHKLRTVDGSKSHGGLDIYGAGIKMVYGDYEINPKFEYLVAKNEVFGDMDELRETDNVGSRKKDMSRVTLELNYKLN